MAQAAVSHRKVIDVDLTEVKLSEWSIIFFDTRIFQKCEHLSCKKTSSFIGGRLCKRNAGRRYIGLCRQHYDENGGCWCKGRHEESSIIQGKKNKEYCFRLSLPSSTSEQLDVLPSSSGLPPPAPEKEERKPEIN